MKGFTSEHGYGLQIATDLKSGFHFQEVNLRSTFGPSAYFFIIVTRTRERADGVTIACCPLTKPAGMIQRHVSIPTLLAEKQRLCGEVKDPAS